jgi:hypothetical protein
VESGTEQINGYPRVIGIGDSHNRGISPRWDFGKRIHDFRFQPVMLAGSFSLSARYVK